MFSAGDSPVIMRFDDSPTDLGHLRDQYPRHRFYSVDVRKSKSIAKQLNLADCESPMFKIYKEGE